MMHELAHCKQMNHSRNFWKVRNQYADQMKGLMEKKYTGEGLWVSTVNAKALGIRALHVVCLCVERPADSFPVSSRVAVRT